MNVKIAALASHSALDVFDGAKDEGFQTIGLCKKGEKGLIWNLKQSWINV
jgi:ATP-utilizing enzymes of ATP-grasp superfamily (probably carboligases)